MSTTIAISEKYRAKQIIGEIVRQAGGLLTSKRALAEHFRQAHLAFAESQPGYLSLWPLVKTSGGPAIGDVDLLLGELVAEGVLKIDETSTNGVSSLRLELAETSASVNAALPGEAVDAIEKAISSRAGEGQVRVDYQSLRSWQEASDGEELNIYLDEIPDAEYAERKQRLGEMASALNDAWK